MRHPLKNLKDTRHRTMYACLELQAQTGVPLQVARACLHLERCSSLLSLLQGLLQHFHLALRVSRAQRRGRRRLLVFACLLLQLDDPVDSCSCSQLPSQRAYTVQSYIII